MEEVNTRYRLVKKYEVSLVHICHLIRRNSQTSTLMNDFRKNMEMKYQKYTLSESCSANYEAHK